MSLLIGCLVPCLGFGTCTVAGFGSINQGSRAMLVYSVIAGAGIALIPGGLMAAVVYWFVRKKKIRDGGP